MLMLMLMVLMWMLWWVLLSTPPGSGDPFGRRTERLPSFSPNFPRAAPRATASPLPRRPEPPLPTHRARTLCKGALPAGGTDSREPQGCHEL